MNAWRRSEGWGGALCLWLLTSCGGSYSQGGGSGGSGAAGLGSGGAVGSTGGSPSVGGSSGSHSAGSVNDPACLYEGTLFPDGTSFPASDGCNKCTCSGGRVGCTLIGCHTPCQYGNQTFMPGQSFPAGDGCNQCSCGQDGSVSCTAKACVESCASALDEYVTALSQAKLCKPGAPNQCQGSIADLRCGCATSINSNQDQGLVALLIAQARYRDLNCSTPFCGGSCGTPDNAVCSPKGYCEDRPQNPSAKQAYCKVAGVVYPSGTSGIPDPTSCNKCSCDDGQLSCTEIYCPIDCPPDSVNATQCAACGPAGGCEVVEHGCLPVCTDRCEQGACIDGVCRTICR